eukprot:768810-Hanusia_phi.AAC.3
MKKYEISEGYIYFEEGGGVMYLEGGRGSDDRRDWCNRRITIVTGKNYFRAWRQSPRAGGEGETGRREERDRRRREERGASEG